MIQIPSQLFLRGLITYFNSENKIFLPVRSRQDIRVIHSKLFIKILAIALSFSFIHIIPPGIPTLDPSPVLTPGNANNTACTSFRDTVPADTVRGAHTKERLTETVSHSASDSIVVNLKDRHTVLYNHAKLDYEGNHLESGIIEIFFKQSLVEAKGLTDSTGYAQKPLFREAEQSTTQDSIKVNFDTGQALIYGMRSRQGELYTGAEISKKVNDSTVYSRNIFITTSDKPVPDYHINIYKAKVIPGKRIIAGGSQLYLAQVPTPVYLPFAYFPITRTRTSGILIPTWGESASRGYYLRNGGYYFAVSDYFDLALTGDIYTNGGWAFRTRSNYALRYKFRGNLQFNFERAINSLPGFSDYSKTDNYNIRWSHSREAAANPNTRFSASVNLGSSKYYRQSLNEAGTNNFLRNDLSSSVSISKKFAGTPFNASLSVTHSQNTNTGVIQMTLPSLNLNMDRIYPFASKHGGKTNALRKTGLTYSMQSAYHIRTTDELFFKPQMFEGARKGMQHRLGMNTNMKVLKYFTLNPSANYKETWYLDYISRHFDEENQTVATDTLNGFKSFREYSTGVSLSTNIYGTFRFKKGRLKAIRHTIRPSVSYSYRPDFSFYDDTYYDPVSGEETAYSPFEGGLYGTPGKGLQNNIGISVNNTFEAKVMPKDSTRQKPEKITLLNNLRFSTSYNMSADSLRWAPVNVSTGINLFKNQLRINLSARLDPYALNAANQRINTFNINNGGSLFRLPSANMNISYRLSNETFKRNSSSKSNSGSQNDLDEGIPEEGFTTGTGDKGKRKQNISLPYRHKIPWNLNLSYSFHYSDARRENEITTHVVNFNGNIQLTGKWDVGISSGYDFLQKDLTHTRLNFQRDLDSWRMNFSWVPFGNSTYYFFIGVKSSLLSDLKYDKQRLPDKRIF